MLPLALIAHVAAACPAGVAALRADLDAAEQSFGAMSLDGFSSAVMTFNSDLVCASEAVPPDLAARAHRVEGLRAFVANDTVAATRAFSAAQAIDPGYRFPDAIVPPGHQVVQLYGAAALGATARAPVAAPARGRLLIDGQPAGDRPTDWPATAQLVAPNGSVTTSAYLRPGDALFAYEVGTAKAASVATRPGTPRKSHASVPLAILGGVALVGAGAAWGLAYDAHNDFDEANADATTSYDRLKELQARTNDRWWVSMGALGVAGGLGLTAVVVGKW
jgi:hypothetical protein